MDYTNVLVDYYSGKDWSIKDGTDYDSLVWNDSSDKPTKDDLDVKLTELQNSEPLKLLRLERDRLLKETDWRASSDLIISEAWKSYRQSLRDLPALSTPKLDSAGRLDVTSIEWPTLPS